MSLDPTELPPVAILCGGRGTRLREHTETLPKPLVEIGGRPIVWHVLQIYISQGFRRFFLLTGYKAELIDSFVSAETWPDGVEVRAVFTGEDTQTGGRVRAIADQLDDATVCVTYADGVANIDLGSLLSFHRDHGRSATLTVVQPRLQFGVADIDTAGVVRGFIEKPRSDHWINGGFFCFETEALRAIGPDDILERAPFESLAAGSELRAFRHAGFWKCMDTYKDAIELNDLWRTGDAPWKLWS